MSQPEFKSESTPTGTMESGVVQPDFEKAKEAPEIQENQSGVVQQQPPTPVVQDQTQQQVVPAQTSSTVTITIPATAQQLEDWAKGSPDDSLTWIAFFLDENDQESYLSWLEYSFGWKCYRECITTCQI